MEKQADLHIHTHYSDSTSSPEEVIEQAHQQGLSCIAITDHDTIDGIQPTVESARKYDIEVIAGVELSTESNGKDIHMLGYLFDYKNQELFDKLRVVQNTRIGRMEKMIEKLKEFGINDIGMEEVCSLVKSDSVGRPHLAHVLLEKGHVNSIQMAFNKYLADGAPVYVAKYKQSPFEAIELIKKYGGISVLAHPMVTGVDELIPSFVEAGLGGMEVYYPNNTKSITNFYTNIAKKHNLVMTGGSDAHGEAKKHTFVGHVKIPYDLVEELKKQVG